MEDEESSFGSQNGFILDFDNFQEITESQRVRPRWLLGANAHRVHKERCLVSSDEPSGLAKNSKLTMREGPLNAPACGCPTRAYPTCTCKHMRKVVGALFPR